MLNGKWLKKNRGDLGTMAEWKNNNCGFHAFPPLFYKYLFGEH